MALRFTPAQLALDPDAVFVTMRVLEEKTGRSYVTTTTPVTDAPIAAETIVMEGTPDEAFRWLEALRRLRASLAATVFTPAQLALDPGLLKVRASLVRDEPPWAIARRDAPITLRAHDVVARFERIEEAHDWLDMLVAARAGVVVPVADDEVVA